LVLAKDKVTYCVGAINDAN